MTHINNQWVEKFLKDFLAAIPPNYPYVIVGSVSLMSHTSKTGYERQIRDIDVIGSVTGLKEITAGLTKTGYRQNVFIDEEFPFYDRLNKLVNKKYFWFEKHSKAMEIIASDFIYDGNLIGVELYPGVRIYLPKEIIIKNNYQSAVISTISPEALYAIYKVGLRTWGKLVKTRTEERNADIKALEDLIDKDKLLVVANHTYLQLGKVKLKIPKRLITH